MVDAQTQEFGRRAISRGAEFPVANAPVAIFQCRAVGVFGDGPVEQLCTVEVAIDTSQRIPAG